VAVAHRVLRAAGEDRACGSRGAGSKRGTGIRGRAGRPGVADGLADSGAPGYQAGDTLDFDVDNLFGNGATTRVSFLVSQAGTIEVSAGAGLHVAGVTTASQLESAIQRRYVEMEVALTKVTLIRPAAREVAPGSGDPPSTLPTSDR